MTEPTRFFACVTRGENGFPSLATVLAHVTKPLSEHVSGLAGHASLATGRRDQGKKPASIVMDGSNGAAFGSSAFPETENGGHRLQAGMKLLAIATLVAAFAVAGLVADVAQARIAGAQAPSGEIPSQPGGPQGRAIGVELAMGVSPSHFPDAGTETVHEVPASVPSQPERPMVERSGETATVSWEAPRDDGGSAALPYELEILMAGTSLRTVGNIRQNSTGIDGLSSEMAYDFRVRALNRVGPGDWSELALPDRVPTCCNGRAAGGSPCWCTRHATCWKSPRA